MRINLSIFFVFFLSITCQGQDWKKNTSFNAQTIHQIIYKDNRLLVHTIDGESKFIISLDEGKTWKQYAPFGIYTKYITAIHQTDQKIYFYIRNPEFEPKHEHDTLKKLSGIYIANYIGDSLKKVTTPFYVNSPYFGSSGEDLYLTHGIFDSPDSCCSKLNLYRSSDEGRSWVNLTQTLPKNIYPYHYTGNGTSIIGFDFGTKKLIQSSNKGLSWQKSYQGLDTVNGTLLCVSAFKGNYYLIQKHLQSKYSTIFKSQDGLLWTSLKGEGLPLDFTFSSPGFEVQNFAAHNDILYLATTDGGLYASKNDGENWYSILGNISSTATELGKFAFTDVEILVSANNHLWSTLLENVLGLNENLKIENHISIYPNPTSNFLMIESKANTTATLSIYDSLGKLISESPLSFTQYRQDMSNIKEGIYLVLITTGEDVYCKKIAVQK